MRTLTAILCCLAAAARAADSAPPTANPVTGYELTLVDMQGSKRVLGTLPPSVFSPRVSPDGKHAAFELADADAVQGAPTRVWIAELDHLDQRRALPMVGTGRNMAAVWTTDGTKVVFQAGGDRPDTLFWRRADGTGEAELLIEGRAAEGVYAQDRQIAFITLKPNRDYGIGLLDTQTRTVNPVVDYPGTEQHSSRISPDSKWIAYASNETGRQEVWVEPLPQTGARHRLTRNGGRHPLWAPDGKALYFDQDGGMYRLDLVFRDGTVSAGAPQTLPIRGFQQGDLRRQFDLLPDGRQFLLLYPVTAR